MCRLLWSFAIVGSNNLPTWDDDDISYVLAESTYS